jgi:hypothetical protein
MSKLPVTRHKSAVPRSASDPAEVIERKDEARQGFGGFVSFHYSYTEVSASGRKARVKAHRASFEDGRLVSESFEADLSPEAYDDVARQARRLVDDQMRSLLRPLSWLLPWTGRRDR